MNAMIGNSLLLSSEGYKISRSVRMRSTGPAYFSRTPSVATNRRTWTWSGWVKRGIIANQQNILLSAGTTATDYTTLFFDVDNKIGFNIVVGNVAKILSLTTAFFRDPSAWYHIVFSLDTTQAVNSNGARLWVNGVQQSLTFTAYTQNTDGYVNFTNLHKIGQLLTSNCDGYLTEINFINGQSLTASSFGQTNSTTGVWEPIAYTGTYGTNGYYLNFSDNSAATAAAIGKDYSGNGNNWTPSGIILSPTTSFNYDSMLDVPTPWPDGGNGRGNYFTLNPAAAVGYTPYIQGNLRFTSPALVGFASIFSAAQGKWYYEYYCNSIATPAEFRVGGGALYYANGNIFTTSVIATVASYTTGDTIGVAVNADAGQVSFYKNGVLQGTYSVTLGTVAVSLAATAPDSCSFNFGQRPYTYTPPSGFLALNTQNLPEPTIVDGAQYFDADIWTGNGSSSRSFSFLDFQPDLVWAKNLSVVSDNQLNDSARGPNLRLRSNTTDGQGANAPNGYLTSFDANGFSATTGSTDFQNYNKNTQAYVAWSWKETPVAGFDIVTYTGTGVVRTIAHNLGVAPSMMIVKQTSSGASDWDVYHVSIGATKRLFLNTTAVAQTTSIAWNDTAPTSSVFTVGTAGDVNANGNTYVAYLFATVLGFSRFASYVGNGSADGPFAWCGFRPRFLMIKSSDTSAGSWIIVDTARNESNLSTDRVFANSDAAQDSLAAIDILSNGFKLRGAANANTSGITYIFAAFAENPFKYALAR